MGRWAQRTIRGGGPPLPPTAIIITRGEFLDSENLRFHFSAPVDVVNFVADFFTVPTFALEGIDISQFSPTELDVTLNDTMPGPGTWEYSGTAPGVVSPQTGAIA